MTSSDNLALPTPSKKRSLKYGPHNILLERIFPRSFNIFVSSYGGELSHRAARRGQLSAETKLKTLPLTKLEVMICITSCCSSAQFQFHHTVRKIRAILGIARLSDPAYSDMYVLREAQHQTNDYVANCCV